MKKVYYIFLIFLTFISCTEKNKDKIKYKTESKDVLFFENSGIKNQQAREIFVEGLEYVENENFKSAKMKFIQADEIENKNPIILNAISQAEIRLGDAQRSNDILLNVLLIDSTYLPTYVNLGQNYMQIRDYQKAKEILLKGRKFTTNKNLHFKSVLLLNLSITFNNLGDFKNGLKYSMETIEISQDKKLTDFASKVKKDSEDGLLKQNRK
jgi:tetratricopeptide (TPR) repeat protein